MQLPRGPGPGLTLALLAGLACSQPRAGETTTDATTDGAAPTADAPITGAPPSDGPRPADAPPSADAPTPDGPRPPDAPPPLDGPPVACTNVTDCGVCRRCDNGTCVPIPSGGMDDTAPSFCGGEQRCDGKGACLSMLGQVCSRSDDCLSGFCRSSVCCDSDCAGSCRYCLMPGRAGSCIDVTGPAPAIGCMTEGEICIAPNRCLGPDKSCTQFQPRDAIDGTPVAQVFVVGRSGRLVAIRLSLVCYEGQEITLEIRRANPLDPEGPLLSSQTVRGPVPPGDVFGEYWLIPLASPVAVLAGDRLAMVVRFRGTTLCRLGLTGGGCNPDGWVYNLSGSPAVWSADHNADLGFRTYVVE
jgi:hypothetical protein